jgi:hypothetical protein
MNGLGIYGHEHLNDLGIEIQLFFEANKEDTICDHNYEVDITCGVVITVCTKCGDLI